MSEQLPDRELDLLVAERIMGYGWFHCAAGVGVGAKLIALPDQLEAWKSIGWQITPISRPPSAELAGCPQFSADIASAMLVVEKMCENKSGVLMRRVNRWYVEFSPRTGNPKQNFGRAQDESLPRAICLAALEAVKGK